jgi:hypothetical protein
MTSTLWDIHPTNFSFGGASCAALGILGGVASCATVWLKIRDGGSSYTASLLLGSAFIPDGLCTRASLRGPGVCTCLHFLSVQLGCSDRAGRPSI